MKSGTRPNVLAAVAALLTLAVPVSSILALTVMPFVLFLGTQAAKHGPLIALAYAGPPAVYSVVCVALLVRARRMDRGRSGRLRLLALAAGGLVYGLIATTLHALAPDFFVPVPKLLVASPSELWPALSLGAQVALGALCVGAALALWVALVSAISTWWLIPERGRRAFFWALDALLLATAVALWRAVLQRTHLEELTAHQAARLSVTFLFGVRVFSRLLPFGFDALELMSFRSLVASRHLRAKKSGFLAAISFLSILAVSVSTCALTTVLSVMGGFRQDLKRKILGNNAHIVIDHAEGGRIGDYERLVALTRKVEGVRGVSPYVSGEVMISSASNLAGAVLRGIDVNHIGEVSELPTSINRGSLEYLAHPEKLTHLPASQLASGISLPKVTKSGSEDEVNPEPAQSARRLSQEMERMMEGDEKAKEPAAEKAPPAPTLPGIVVGQELARSLRLYLGDEVNVVTPLGELGPTGPMPKSRPFRVAGIFYSGMYEYDMKFAYVTLSSAQKFLGAGDRASGIEVTVREPERAQEAAQAIAQRLSAKNLRVQPWQELNKNLFGALALEKLAMFIALGIAILVASFCIFATLTLLVQEKGREVAVLKAMGAADRAIIGIFVLEGTMIGMFGSSLGLAMGYLVCFAAERFGVRLNPEVYYIDRLPVHIDPAEFLTVGIAAVAVCLLVTLYPAQLASRLRPVEALRYE